VSDYKERMNALIGDILRDRQGWKDLKSVKSVDEQTEYGGYCETCSYESIVLDVTYVNVEDETVTRRYQGSLADLTGFM